MRMNASEITRARSTDMIAFFENRYGLTFAHRGSTYRCHQHPSLVVKDDRLSWFWHSKGIGGYGVLDYLMKVEDLSFHQAVEIVGHVPTVVSPMPKEPTEKKLVLPEKAGALPNRLVNYLCNRRSIGKGIVHALLEEGKIYEDQRGNVVFLGFDELGKARFASLRGTHGEQKFRMDCAGSDKRYGFNMGASPSERLYIFESPIDAMSHASLENRIQNDKNAWRLEHRLSLSGTADTALPLYLESHPHIKELVFCLDSDPPGREAAVTIARKYSELGYATRIELPRHKDYNEDLCALLDTQPARPLKACAER